MQMLRYACRKGASKSLGLVTWSDALSSLVAEHLFGDERLGSRLGSVSMGLQGHIAGAHDASLGQGTLATAAGSTVAQCSP